MEEWQEREKGADKLTGVNLSWRTCLEFLPPINKICKKAFPHEVLQAKLDISKSMINEGRDKIRGGSKKCMLRSGYDSERSLLWH